MKITCSACKKAFEIPDERIPIGKAIAFPCPACENIIELDITHGLKGAGRSGLEENGHETGEALKKHILKNVGQLPPMPQTVLKAREIITDQAIAARVLKLANSSYYGLSGKVASIQHASVVLGHKALAELVTMGGTAAILGTTLPGYGLDAGELWRHCLGVAFGARLIANKKNPALSNDAFAAGLLHDAGKLILDPYILERREAFQNFIADSDDGFLAAEKAILAFDHCEIAAEVCKQWNIPKALTTAIRYHHYPSRSQNDPLAYIVHMADGIAMMTGLGLGIDGMMYEFEEDAMAFLDLHEQDLDGIMAEVLESVQKISNERQ
ncbi:MAG: zinc-ribbon domain-containing protein [Deltaproteobacteria bacterium]|nr:zinc-ribbon domain-containing protein [Deltaproteobacteria bacterium]